MSIDARYQQFTCTAFYSLFRPFKSISTLRPFIIRTSMSIGIPYLFKWIILYIKTYNDALITELLSPFCNKGWISQSGGINGNLISTSFHKSRHILNRGDATTNSKRHKYLIRGFKNHICESFTTLCCGRNI